MTLQCPACPFQRSQQGKVNAHILATKDDAHAPYAEKLLQCNVCLRLFSTSHARTNHQRSHQKNAAPRPQLPPQLSDSPTQIVMPRASDDETFRLLGQHSPLAARLLALLCMFDITNIPEICFFRFRVPRECWGSDGEIEPVVLHTTDQLFDVLSVESWFNSTIECLESTGLIESRSGTFDKRMFIIKHTVQEYVKQAVPDHEQLEWLCLVVVCHAFPGRNEDIAFGDSVRSLLPQVQHAFSHCHSLVDKIVSHPTVGYGMVLTLLLSSYTSSKEWKIHALNLTESILSHNPQFGNGTMYLKALKRQREREISRRLPNMSIQSLCEEPRPIDPRTNTLYGQHLRSNVQDLIMKDCNLGTALLETCKFKFYTTLPSSMEKVESYHMDFMKGKIYRWLAKFSMAHETLKLTILSPYFQSDGTGCSVISHFVGVLCELRCLEEAESTARQYIRHLESLDDKVGNRRDLMSFRSLRLSLAETLVCRIMVKRADGAPCTDEDFQRLAEAEGILDLLKTEYELSKMEKGASWASEMKYLQVCIGRALTSHLMYRFDEAYKRWEAAREPVHHCKDVVTGFLSMIIDYSLCDISQKWGKREDAARLLNRASTCFATIGREYWWTGLGTFLLNIYMGSIQNSGISSTV